MEDVLELAERKLSRGLGASRHNYLETKTEIPTASGESPPKGKVDTLEDVTAMAEQRLSTQGSILDERVKRFGIFIQLYFSTESSFGTGPDSKHYYS